MTNSDRIGRKLFVKKNGWVTIPDKIGRKSLAQTTYGHIFCKSNFGWVTIPDKIGRKKSSANNSLAG